MHTATDSKTSPRPTVIFDLGGVLVDVDFLDACARFAVDGKVRAGAVRDAITDGKEKIAFDTGRLSAQQFATHFCGSLGMGLPYTEFAEIWCDIFTEKREVTGLLDEIGKHADLMLLSNTDPLHLDYIRRHFGFLEKFGRLVLSYEIGYVKPAPQIYQRAISLCAPGSRMIYFDDVPEFVIAARECGLPAEHFVDAAKLRSDLERFGVL
ncbi:MAG: hypothetical protein IH605_06990 [Burkholderiales bacterium]|nr:hypothetical protein [Burkholderiales bacterium]